MPKAFFMETTKISPEKTLAEIQAVLSRFNVKQMVTDYENGNVAALSFMLEIEGNFIPFRLPCRWQEMKKKFIAMKKKPRGGDTLDDWSRRVAWRQVYRWVEAQIALIETGMVKLQEVFLPYVQVGPNRTMYDAIADQRFQAIADKPSE